MAKQERIDFLSINQLWALSDLTLFHFTVMYPALGDHDVDELLHLIVDRCPNLEKLCLNFGTSRNTMYLDKIWKGGNWKHLHHLYLGHDITLRDVEDGNLFKHFMARHPGIECLEYLGPGNILGFCHLPKANVFKGLRALNLLDVLIELSSPPLFNLEIVPILQVNMFEKVECCVLEAPLVNFWKSLTFHPYAYLLLDAIYIAVRVQEV
jgi:hypothetical protein